MEKMIDHDKLLNYIQNQSKTLEVLTNIVKTMKDKDGNVFDLSQEQLAILTDLNLRSNSQTDIIELNTGKKSKFPKFSSMIATQLERMNNKFSFIKENDFSLENLAFKAQLSYEVTIKNTSELYSKGINLFEKSKADLKLSAKKYGILVKENSITTGIGKVFESISLIGNKLSVNKLNKQFKNSLELIGFEAHDLLDTSKKSFLNSEQVEQNIFNKLSKNLNLQKTDDSYSFEILNGLNPERKFEMMSKVIWPQLSKELAQSMNLAISLSELLNKNNNIKSLLNFSKKNNIHTDVIIHSLKNNPEILKDYPNYDNLLKNKDIILSSSDKFGTLIQNNLVILNSLVRATSILKQEISNSKDEKANQFIEEMNNSIITKKIDKKNNKEIIYSLTKIEENVTRVTNEQKNTRPSP